ELSGDGTVYHEVLNDSVPEVVRESERKPISNATIGNKLLKAHKIAVVHTYSDEFKRDLQGSFHALIGRLPCTLARTFDLSALHGVGAPTAEFDNLSGATEISIANAEAGSTDAYAGFLAALAAVPDLNAWALSPQGEVTALSNRDTSGGPILVGSAARDGS